MRSVTVLFLILLGAAPLTSQAPRAAPAVPVARIDSLVRARMAERRIPGLAIAVSYDGRTLFERAWGLANVETQTPLTLESVFELASITKQFTAAAIMMLVQDGKVRLDDTLSGYVEGAPPHWSGITIRQLLTHTSGINGPSVPSFDGSPLLRITTRQAFRAAADLRPMFPPGAGALYSDEGYFLLGMVIERASGMRYAEFLERRIFTPLGLGRTSVLDRRRVLPGRVATYEMQRDTLVNWRRDWQHELPAFFGVWSTIGDLMKWDQSLRTGQLLARASLEQLWTPATLAGGRTAIVTGSPYGFGFALADLRGGRFAAHGGASGVYLLHFFDEPLSIAVLGNLSNTAGPNATLLARDVAGLLRPEYRPVHHLSPQPDPRPALTDSIAALLAAMGTAQAHPRMTAGHRAWFEAAPPGFRANWFRRLGSLGPMEFLACDEVRGRGVRMLEAVERICHYRGQAGAETLFITVWLTAEGQASFVRFGRRDEL